MNSFKQNTKKKKENISNIETWGKNVSTNFGGGGAALLLSTIPKFIIIIHSCDCWMRVANYFYFHFDKFKQFPIGLTELLKYKFQNKKRFIFVCGLVCQCVGGAINMLRIFIITKLIFCLFRINSRFFLCSGFFHFFSPFFSSLKSIAKYFIFLTIFLSFFFLSRCWNRR